MLSLSTTMLVIKQTMLPAMMMRIMKVMNPFVFIQSIDPLIPSSLSSEEGEGLEDQSSPNVSDEEDASEFRLESSQSSITFFFHD